MHTDWKSCAKQSANTHNHSANIYRQCKSMPALSLLTVLSPSLLASGHPALFEQLLRREKEENFLKLANPGPDRQVWLWLRWRRRPKQQAEVEAHAGDALVNSGKLPSWNTLTWGVLRERLSLRDRLPLSCRRGTRSSLISSVRSPHPHNYQLFHCGTSGAKIIRFVSFRYYTYLRDTWPLSQRFLKFNLMSHRERRLLTRQKYVKPHQGKHRENKQLNQFRKRGRNIWTLSKSENQSIKEEKSQNQWKMGEEEFQPKSFSRVYTEFHIDKAK